MALSEKHRSSIYQTLSPVLGEEEAEALLSQFPARELDEPVTQAFVRAEIAEVRADLVGEIGGLRAELHREIGGLRAELHTELGALRTELHTELGDVRAEIGAVEARLTEMLRQQTIWFMGALISGLGLAAAIGAAFH